MLPFTPIIVLLKAYIYTTKIYKVMVVIDSDKKRKFQTEKICTGTKYSQSIKIDISNKIRKLINHVFLYPRPFCISNKRRLHLLREDD